MTWLLAGGTACAVFVVLAGIWIGRAMRDLDRWAEGRVVAPVTAVRPPAVPAPRRPEPERSARGAADCPVRETHARAARQPVARISPERLAPPAPVDP